MPSYLGYEGWEGQVDIHLHPPHTIGNSIQLQPDLAIPQLYFGGLGSINMSIACL